MSFELRATHTTPTPTPLTWSLHIRFSTSPHLHLRSLRLKSMYQHIGSPTNIIIFSSVFGYLLQAQHLTTVGFVCLKSYILGCLHRVIRKRAYTSVHQLRADTRHVPSHIQEGLTTPIHVLPTTPFVKESVGH